jgi:hypothetical protein
VRKQVRAGVSANGWREFKWGWKQRWRVPRLVM